METTQRFQAAAVAWAAGGEGAADAAATARELAVHSGMRTAVLVEGVSDRTAVRTLAALRGIDLDAEGVSVVPMGGAMSVGRFVSLLGPQGLGVRLTGLCDEGEALFFRRALERAGVGPLPGRAELEARGFQVCAADLEDELVRALGTGTVQEVVEAQGDLRSFRIFQQQPAQRDRTAEQQLRRFLGTTRGRKTHYARVLVEALDPARVPPPLDRLLAHL